MPASKLLTSIKSQTEGEEKTVSKRQFIIVKGIKRDRPDTNVNTLKGTRVQCTL
jgi:hypothetical protein